MEYLLTIIERLLALDNIFHNNSFILKLIQ